MSRRTLTSNAFHSALAEFRGVVSERRARRLTPVAPPPPRDSDPQAGEALPEHGTGGSLDADAHPGLAPSVAAWAWSEGDSDDGTRR